MELERRRGRQHYAALQSWPGYRLWQESALPVSEQPDAMTREKSYFSSCRVLVASNADRSIKKALILRLAMASFVRPDGSTSIVGF